MSMIKRYANRVIYLAKGQVVAQGAPEEVIEQYLQDVAQQSK